MTDHSAELCDTTFRRTQNHRLNSQSSAGSLHSALWIIDTDTCRDPGRRHTPMNTANTHTDIWSQHAAG